MEWETKAIAMERGGDGMMTEADGGAEAQRGSGSATRRRVAKRWQVRIATHAPGGEMAAAGGVWSGGRSVEQRGQGAAPDWAGTAVEAAAMSIKVWRCGRAETRGAFDVKGGWRPIGMLVALHRTKISRGHWWVGYSYRACQRDNGAGEERVPGGLLKGRVCPCSPLYTSRATSRTTTRATLSVIAVPDRDRCPIHD
ncbi:hypothetical protein AcW1_003156 [Taiwanofungus camphoratus]|nr:hypothetical protein AcW1_003156 [Antrodia cinnamomea]